MYKPIANHGQQDWKVPHETSLSVSRFKTGCCVLVPAEMLGQLASVILPELLMLAYCLLASHFNISHFPFNTSGLNSLCCTLNPFLLLFCTMGKKKEHSLPILVSTIIIFPLIFQAPNCSHLCFLELLQLADIGHKEWCLRVSTAFTSDCVNAEGSLWISSSYFEDKHLYKSYMLIFFHLYNDCLFIIICFAYIQLLIYQESGNRFKELLDEGKCFLSSLCTTSCPSVLEAFLC